MYNVLLFDVYNVFYRAFWKHDTLTKIDDKMIPLDGICNFFELVNSYIEKYGTQNCEIYWLMDNAKSSLLKNRKMLDENYKKNRKEQPEYFYTALNIIELILKFYRDNSYVLRKQNIEGDDFVLPIIDNYIKEHDHVLLFSTDLDWSRALLNDKEHDIIVNQYTRASEILTTKSFEDKFGFKPTVTNICFWKCFYGDKSDNILPALDNYPKTYFLDAIRKFQHIDTFIKGALEGKLPYLDTAWRIKIKQLQERLRLNWNLISSMDISVTDLEQWKINCTFKANKLLIIYSTLNILGRFDNRVKVEEKHASIWQMLEGEDLNRAN